MINVSPMMIFMMQNVHWMVWKVLALVVLPLLVFGSIIGLALQ